MIKNNYRDFVGLVLTDRVSEEATLFEIVPLIVPLTDIVRDPVKVGIIVVVGHQVFVGDAK